MIIKAHTHNFELISWTSNFELIMIGLTSKESSCWSYNRPDPTENQSSQFNQLTNESDTFNRKQDLDVKAVKCRQSFNTTQNNVNHLRQQLLANSSLLFTSQ